MRWFTRLLLLFIAVLAAAVILVYLNRQSGSQTAQIRNSEPQDSAVQALWMRPLIALPQTESPPCLNTYTIYNGRAYYASIPILEADLPTFVALPTSNCVAYAKDKNHVYIGNMGLAYEIVPGADPNSFVPFFDAGGLTLYSEDKTHVYETEDIAFTIPASSVDIEEIASADPKTFSVFYDKDGYFTGYAKDKNHVYYLLDSIPLADPVSFVVLRGIHGLLYADAGGYFDAGFGKDNARIYYGRNPVDGADVTTFTPINTPSGFWTLYAKDKNKVYCENQDVNYFDIEVLQSADHATFVPETNSSGGTTDYAHDQAHQWHECTMVG